LRDRRQVLWSLLSIARMRGAAGKNLPELTVAAIQSALAPDEAVVSWMWVATGILLVLALDRTRIHAERIILSEQRCATLENYVGQILDGKLLRSQLGTMVNKLAADLLPPDTRAFIAGARRLILSPHRRLHLIPFHAAQFDGAYLIEQAAIRYVPNLGSLLIPWTGTSKGEIVSVGINDFGNRVPGLRGAEAEARSVAAIWSAQGDKATLLAGPQATRAAFLALPLDRCRILHLATHGLSVYDRQLKGDPFASLLCLRDGDLEAMTLAELPVRVQFRTARAVLAGPCGTAWRRSVRSAGGVVPGRRAQRDRHPVDFGRQQRGGDPARIAPAPGAGRAGGRGVAPGHLRLSAHTGRGKWHLFLGAVVHEFDRAAARTKPGDRVMTELTLHFDVPPGADAASVTKALQERIARMEHVEAAQVQEGDQRLLVVDDIVLVLTVSATLLGAGATALEQLKRFIVAAKDVGKELGLPAVSVEAEEKLVAPEKLTEADARFIAGK
jgi:hypothetical protein